jgi:hypothetical protein
MISIDRFFVATADHLDLKLTGFGTIVADFHESFVNLVIRMKRTVWLTIMGAAKANCG